MKTTNEIEKYNPCKEAIFFRNKYKTFKEAWDNCNRGDWMLWIAYQVVVDKRILTYAKALCAETVIHLMKDKRSINAIKVAKLYGKGKATKQELNLASANAISVWTDDGGGDAKKENLLKTADICRKILTKEILKLIK